MILPTADRFERTVEVRVRRLSAAARRPAARAPPREPERSPAAGERVLHVAPPAVERAAAAQRFRAAAVAGFRRSPFHERHTHQTHLQGRTNARGVEFRRRGPTKLARRAFDRV